jgi:MOSC domain-containing protein YiiM
MSAAGRIVQLSVSPGGVPKRAVPGARVTRLGLEGDAQRDHEHHGGPERALCLFPLEAIAALAAEGHAVQPGVLGENVTIEGLDWSTIVPGAHLLLGERVLVQVTRKRHPGWSRVYARVLVEGALRAGDAVRLLSDSEASEAGAAAR